MKKFLLMLTAGLASLNTMAIDPAGSRVDTGDGGLDIPTPLLIIGLIIASIGCIVLGCAKDKVGKRETPGMIWLGVMGLIGLVFIFSSL